MNPCRRYLPSVVALTLISSLGQAWAAGAPRIVIEKVPHVLQKPDFCGEACAAMWLAKLGKKVTQDQVFNASGLDPALGRGCYTAELKRALESIGFKPGTTYYEASPAHEAADVGAQWQAVQDDLHHGVPSIVCMHYDESPGTTEHFRLVLGYDAAADAVIYHEPALVNGAYQRMPRERFLKLWPLRTSGNSAMLIRLRLEAGGVKDMPVAAARGAADFAQHVMQLRARLPSDDFHIVVQTPFVVVGDGSEQALRYNATHTVQWAVERLKRNYFGKDPQDILDIWLFKNEESYNRNALLLFGSKPTTPYGYYSDVDKALVMNIATGGGTLVHEIVHPFMAANFPACPPWFNEGMGSLYEQCGEQDGQIHGYTNWRLPGLQEAINRDTVPTFKALMAMDADAFYNRDRGTNYAQARYLLYYLQERNLLTRYYREFTAAQKSDPTGYATLQKLLGETDMAAFQARWQKFVLGLRYP